MLGRKPEQDEEFTLVISPSSQRELWYIIHALGLNENLFEDIGEAIGAALSMEAAILAVIAKDSRVFIIDKDGQRHEVLAGAPSGNANGKKSWYRAARD